MRHKGKSSQLIFWAVDHSMYAVPHMRNIEIQKNCLRELVVKAGIAGALEYSSPKRAVHRAVDDVAGFVWTHGEYFLRVLGVLCAEWTRTQAMSRN